MNMNPLIIIAFVICFINCIWNYAKAVKSDDALHLKLTYLYIFVTVMFIMTIQMQSPVLYTVCGIGSYICLGYTILFGRRTLEANEEKSFAISMLQDCGIDYRVFKKLSYQEQMNMLNSAVFIWRDEISYKLIEEETDLDNFRCILKKENK